ncbi:MAG: Peptidase caspase catalytic subunit p20 [Flavisolibacter sp.]|nr:Peptidase caspase catalytic subunit p20 [Flavisolibacter sp.]
MSTTSIQSVTNAFTDEQENENPFVGLRPYEAEESYLFFGRGKQTTELLQKLFTTRFIGVVGSSGCGKSSLIKAGLIPKLKAGFLTNERDHWITASMRPAGNPLAFLSEALSTALGSQLTGDDSTLFSESGSSFLKAIHEKGTQGITDILLPVFEKSPCNLLLLVDQFEELFTTKEIMRMLKRNKMKMYFLSTYCCHFRGKRTYRFTW